MEKLDKIIKRERDLLQKKLQEALIPAERAEEFLQDFIRFLTGSPEIPSLSFKETIYFSSFSKKSIFRDHKKRSNLKGYLSYIWDKGEIAEYVDDWGWSMDLLNKHKLKSHTENPEPLIDYIEQQHQEKLRDEDHLAELLELPELKDEKLKTSQKEALRNLIYEAKFAKYGRALDITIESGGSFDDLMEVDPSIYALPDQWEGVYSYDRYSTVLLTISLWFNLKSPRMTATPSLRYVAKELKAPYSVMMDLHSLVNKNKKISQRAK